MTDKKTKEKKKKKPENKKDTTKNKYSILKKELKEAEEKLLRSYANLQNYQKRMEKEICTIEEETKKRYLTELIDLHELLKKAYLDKDPKQALKLMINNIENFFNKENIKYIDCIGKKFDHNLHHAVTTVNKKDCEDDIIIDEVKKGYMLKNKLLRPSQVIVVKNEKK